MVTDHVGRFGMEYRYEDETALDCKQNKEEMECESFIVNHFVYIILLALWTFGVHMINESRWERITKGLLFLRTRLQDLPEMIYRRVKRINKKGSFSCSECEFPVAEFRSHICVDCGLSSGFLTKDDQNLRLNSDTQQIENGNLMCVGCAVEGVHADHQTINYQQLKLGPISIEKNKNKDSELADKRNTVVNSQTMITVARLLQTARVELSQLSEQTSNAVTWDEFNSTWNAADIELRRAHSITENFLKVADDTEKSLEKVIAGLEAIRTGCKVFVKNSGKGNICEGANHDEINTDCSASIITNASEWEALSEGSEKSAENVDSQISPDLQE